MATQENGRFEFSPARGGPFYDIQKRLKLVRDDSLRAGRRSLIFIALAWGVPVLLCLLSGRQAVALDLHSYFTDLSVWAKYVVAIGAFILAEAQVERGLRLRFLQLIRSQIIPQSSFPDAARAVGRALVWRDSRIAEIICLAIASGLSVFTVVHLGGLPNANWAVHGAPGGNHITAAGWWTILVSQPFFVFLFLRMLWRHQIWSRLLRAIARLDLRLVASHPDRMAGLSFLSDYPNAYILFVFGSSVALAGGIIKNIDVAEFSTTSFGAVMVGWLVLVLLHFVYALLAFSKPLTVIKEATRLRASLEATRYWRQAERKILGRNIAANSDDEARMTPEVTDPSAHFEGADKLVVTMVTKKTLIPVAAAALLPVALVGATSLPIMDIIVLVRKILLL